MDRTQLIIIIAVVLFAAFLLGWILRWGYGSLNRINAANMGEIDDLANRLHEAELQKDEAEQLLHDREWELKNKLAQTQAELDAAMAGLGEARREVDHLRTALDERG